MKKNKITTNDTVKPDIDSLEVTFAIRQVFNTLKSKTTNPIPASYINNAPFFVKVDSHLERINLKSIYHIEAKANYVEVFAGAKRYILHSSLKRMESKLPERDFKRVHKSYIVRLDCISEIKEDSLTVADMTIPLSISYKQELMDSLCMM